MTRFRAAYATLAAAAGVLSVLTVLAIAEPAPVHCATRAFRTPGLTLSRFLLHDVGRDRPELGYPLVGLALRTGFDCRAWASGDIPVAYLPAVEVAHVTAIGKGPQRDLPARIQRTLAIPWHDEHGRRVVSRMLVELTRRRDRTWVVTYFQPSVLYGAAAGG